MIKHLLVFSGIFFLTAFTGIENSPPVSFTIDFTTDLLRGSVSGTVVIPAQNTERRRFRGSSYRSRGNSTASTGSSEETNNQYENTIVSAHPLSFSLSDDMSSEPMVIEQKDATFFPNVTPVTIGTVVQFVNNDPFFHNVFSLTPGSKFNIGRRPTGDIYSKQIEAPKWKVTGIGPITLFCDVHSQMKATILSLDTTFFTRLNEDGSYQLNDLPNGEYEIRVFSPGFEIISKKITVDSNANTESNFNLTS